MIFSKYEPEDMAKTIIFQENNAKPDDFQKKYSYRQKEIA